MARKAFTLDALRALDMGKAHEAFQGHLLRVARDCLAPLPDEVARVEALAVAWVGERLAEGCGDVPSYFGAP